MFLKFSIYIYIYIYTHTYIYIYNNKYIICLDISVFGRIYSFHPYIYRYLYLLLQISLCKVINLADLFIYIISYLFISLTIHFIQILVNGWKKTILFYLFIK